MDTRDDVICFSIFLFFCCLFYIHDFVWRTLRKIPSFHLISGDSSKTTWKLCLSAKFPHREIRWNYGILRSGNWCSTMWTVSISCCESINFYTPIFLLNNITLCYFYHVGHKPLHLSVCTVAQWGNSVMGYIFLSKISS